MTRPIMQPAPLASLSNPCPLHNLNPIPLTSCRSSFSRMDHSSANPDSSARICALASAFACSIARLVAFMLAVVSLARCRRAASSDAPFASACKAGR